MLIGITGLAGSGKSEVSAVLVNQRGFRSHAFADPLKEMLLTAGFHRHQLYGSGKGVLDTTFGKTPRQIMQTLGTGWAREMVHPDFWVKLWERRIAHSLAMGRHVVADDIRFPNEADAIRAHGGQVWRVIRPGVEAMDHASEKNEVVADLNIYNNAGLWELNTGTLAALAAA